MAVSWLLCMRVRHKVKNKIENEAKHTVNTSSAQTSPTPTQPNLT
jgi:hypothetical protein